MRLISLRTSKEDSEFVEGEFITGDKPFLSPNVHWCNTDNDKINKLY